MDIIDTKVKEIICAHLGVSSAKDDDNIVVDLGADSLDVVELAMAFEDEFDIAIPDDVAQSIYTVGDAVSVIKKIKGEV